MICVVEEKRNIICKLLKEHDIETAEDVQDAFKNLLGETIKEMVEAEMDDYLGSERLKNSDNGIIETVTNYQATDKKKRVGVRT